MELTDIHETAQRTHHLREENERLRRMVREDALRRKNAEVDAERARTAAVERRERAEAHRLKALPHLADRLALAAFAYAEQAEGRVMVRDQLAQALLAVLFKSGLHQDLRFDRPPD